MGKLLYAFIGLLISIELLSAPKANAQTPVLAWQQTYGNPIDSEWGLTSARFSNNLYLHAGYVENGTTFQVSPYVVFTDGSGNFLRDTLYQNIDQGKIMGVAVNEDSSFVACGTFKDSIGSYAFFLFKANQSGSIVWLRTFAGPIGNNMSVIRQPDGYLMVSDNQVKFIKTDFNGKQQWIRAYGQALNSGCESIIPMSDGSYLATGWSIKGGSATVSTFHKNNYLLLKLRPNGDTIFTKVIGNPTNCEIGHAAAQTIDGGVAIVGAYVPNVPQTKRQGQLLKLDSLLNLQWEMKVMPNGGDWEYGCEFFAIQPTVSSEYVIAGQNKQTNFVQSYIARISAPLSISVPATINWSQFIPWGVDLRAVLFEDNGSAIVGGTGYINVNGSGNAQVLVAKFTNLGQPFRPNYCTSPPSSQFSYQIRPDSLIFTNNSRSGLRYGVISKWEYFFGDGATYTTYNPVQANRVGHYYQPQHRVSGTKVRLVVTNNLFCTDTLMLYPFGGGPMGIEKSHSSPLPLLGTAYPNPTAAEANIPYSLPKNYRKASIIIREIATGREIRKYDLKRNETSLKVDLSSFCNGLYLYSLSVDDKPIATRKLAVMK